jgi:AAA domain
MRLHSYDDVRRNTAYLQTVADWKEGFERRVQLAQERLEAGTLSEEEQDQLLEEGAAQQPVTMDLVKEHGDLIAAIRNIGQVPVAVVLDTLNRSLNGSESSDEDMSAYVRATDAIREAFDCSVLVVHHCGINDSRPRGHTSLTGAADAQLSVKRDYAGNILVTVEFMKDGESGDTIVSKLESIEIGIDEDGEPISSCIVVQSEATEEMRTTKLTKNQQTYLSILKSNAPIPLEALNDKLPFPPFFDLQPGHSRRGTIKR